jgi:hypothetical protein
MQMLFDKTKERAAEFCARCGAMCERQCRADESARQTFDQLLRQGWRLA